MRARVRAVVARVMKPFSSWIDRRLAASGSADTGRRIEQLHGVLGAWTDRTAETDRYLGASLSRLRDAVASADLTAASGVSEMGVLLRELRATRNELGFLHADVRQVLGEAPLAPEIEPRLETLDGVTADFLNRALGYKGLAAQAGVFVNEAVNHVYTAGQVQVGTINERIAEVPFVFREISRLTRGARVVDVGSAESSVALSLATLGYDVTAVDPRGYAFPHEHLTARRVGLAELDANEPFDAAVLLSVIEHIGIEHYEQHDGEGADLEVMRTLRRLVRVGGTLLLTTPFGRARHAGFQRIYDDSGIRRLLDGWDVEHVEVVQRVSDTEWRLTDMGIDPVDDDEYRVVLVVATRSAD